MKGISPIIATVIIIAFTIAVGGIMSVFSTGLLESTTQTVEEQVEEHVSCQDTQFKIEKVTCNEDSSLLGMWHFEEGSGSTSRDYSTNGRTMNLTSPVWTAAGKNGKALQFTGSNYGAVQGSESLNPEKFTIEAWVYKP